MTNRTYFGLSLCFTLLFSMVYLTAVHYAQVWQVSVKALQIEKQVALDLPLLDVANPFLNQAGDVTSVVGYMQRLNAALENDNLVVSAISSTQPESSLLKRDQFYSKLHSNNEQVFVLFSKNIPLLRKLDVAFIILFAFISVALTYWLGLILQQTQRFKAKVAQKNVQAKSQNVALLIDLQTKTVASSYDEQLQVSLANKPLCFYLALIDFCLAHPDIVLNQNKHVPEELIALANKYFYRLTELGHTIRKRPNFNNSLDKTLSEIRAVLDEVFEHHSELKAIYYPPKASGEGSRSRIHSYGLKNIAKGRLEVKGK